MGDDFDLPLPEPPKRRKASLPFLGFGKALGGKRTSAEPAMSSKKVDRSLKELDGKRKEMEAIEVKLTEKERILSQVEEKIQAEQRILGDKEKNLSKKEAELEKKTASISQKIDHFQGILKDLGDEARIKEQIIKDMEENIKLKKQYLNEQSITGEMLDFMRIVDGLLGKLPDKKIKEIMKTKEFKFYEKMMHKYQKGE